MYNNWNKKTHSKMNSSLDIVEEKDQRILSVRNYQNWIEKN